MSSLLTIGNFGLLLAAIGSISAACAIGPPKEGGATLDDAEVVFLNHPRLFRSGLILIAVGSLLQLKV